MKKERNALRAGLFIVGAIVASAVVIVVVNGAGRFAEGLVLRTVSFKLTDDVGGLRAGDDVRVGGWKVGTVRAIDAVGLETPDPKLRVTFAVPARFKIRDGAKVGVQQSLTGAASLNVESLGAGKEYAEADLIPGMPDPKTAFLASLGQAGPDVAAMVADARAAVADVRQSTIPKVNAAVDSFKVTGDSTTALVTDVKGQVPKAVDKYNGVADKTGAMMQSITDMVGPATTDWKGLLANLNQASGTIKDKLPAMMDNLNQTVVDARQAMVDIKGAAASANDAMGSVKKVIGGNEGKLDGMIASLKVTTDNLKAASAEIRRSPWRLLYKPAPNEVANLSLYDSARQFADGANSLNDAAGALRDALKTGGAKPEDVKALVEKLEKSFDKFKDVEGKLWTEVK